MPLFKNFPLVLIISIAIFSCSKGPGYQKPVIIEKMIVISPSELKPGVPKFFTWKHDRRKVNFFFLKIDDRVSAYLDACASCYPGRLGYKFQEGYLVCNYCQMKYSVTELEKGIGSCFPIKLDLQEVGGKFSLPLTELEKHASKF